MNYLFYYRSIWWVNYGKDLFDIVTKTDSIKNTLTGYYNTLNGNATNIDLNDINNKINVEIQKLNDIYSNPNKTLHNYKPDRFTQDQGGSHITLDVGICEDIYNNVNDPSKSPEQFV